MAYDEPGDRIITEEDYQALNEATEQVADASHELDEGVKALQAVVKKCCLHRGREKLAS